MSDDFFDANILIIGNTQYSLQYIEKILREHGYKNIIFAKKGSEAFELINNTISQIKEYKERGAMPIEIGERRADDAIFKNGNWYKEDLDLIILDLLLPDMSGLEVLKYINTVEKLGKIPVIVQSNFEDEHDKEAAFALGANDFISNTGRDEPIHKIDLLCRVASQLRQHQLLKSLQYAKAIAEAELEDATKAMNSILPNDSYIKNIEEKYGLSIAWLYRPSLKLGGDFYDIIEYDDSRLGFYMWDFSGHGILAAINTFRLYSIINHSQNFIVHTANSFLSSVNNVLFSMLERQYFATMFYCILNTKSKVLEFSCAACPPPVLISITKGEYQLLKSNGFPLGVVDKCQYKSNTINVKDWDMLLIYSDALIETEDANGNLLNIEEIAKYIIEKCNKITSASKIKSLIMDIFGKVRFENLKDDLTLNIIVLNGTSA